MFLMALSNFLLSVVQHVVTIVIAWALAIAPMNTIVKYFIHVSTNRMQARKGYSESDDNRVKQVLSKSSADGL